MELTEKIPRIQKTLLVSVFGSVFSELIHYELKSLPNSVERAALWPREEIQNSKQVLAVFAIEITALYQTVVLAHVQANQYLGLKSSGSNF